MKKCSQCKKLFPEEALKKMINILDRKAYLIYVCPNCQFIVLNNPNYYYLVEPEK